MTPPYLDRYCHEALYEVDLVMLTSGKSRPGRHDKSLRGGVGKRDMKYEPPSSIPILQALSNLKEHSALWIKTTGRS